ncbi:nucleic acid/nucleotide deaminase domain-containing protein [Streptomyces sp. NPDC001393]
MPPTEIEALYSERSPCDACAPKLENLLKPGAPITYSVPNGSASSNLLYKLIQRFEGTAFLRSTQHSAEQIGNVSGAVGGHQDARRTTQGEEKRDVRVRFCPRVRPSSRCPVRAGRPRDPSTPVGRPARLP